MKWQKIKNKVEYHTNKYGEYMAKKGWFFSILADISVMLLFGFFLIAYMVLSISSFLIPLGVAGYLLNKVAFYYLQYRDYLHEKFVFEIIIGVFFASLVLYIIFKYWIKYIVNPISNWFNKENS